MALLTDCVCFAVPATSVQLLVIECLVCMRKHPLGLVALRCLDVAMGLLSTGVTVAAQGVTCCLAIAPQSVLTFVTFTYGCEKRGHSNQACVVLACVFALTMRPPCCVCAPTVCM
jgi:hypothetical protein